MTSYQRDSEILQSLVNIIRLALVLNPELRFGQMLSNLFQNLDELFYIHDEELIKKIKENYARDN